MNLRGWRRVIPALLILFIAAGILPLAGGAGRASAGGGWSVWLYNDATGELLRVHPDGTTVESYEFPLPFGVSSLPHALTFSRTGDRMAFCLTDDAGITSVRVYDIRDALYRGVYEAPGMVQGCWLEEYSFSEDGSQLAAGLFHHYPDPADPHPEWELIVIQAETGAVLHRLTARDPAVLALSVDIRGTVPAVVTFDQPGDDTPGRIRFKPILYGTEGAPEYLGLVWQLDDGSLRFEEPYGKGGLDLLLSTGEAVYLDEYDYLPKGLLEGPGYLYNVVVYANALGDTYTVYHDGAAVLGSPTFIDGGRRIAAFSYVPPGPPAWVSIDRAGTITPLSISDEVYQVWGIPDGYVYLSDGGVEPQTPVLYHSRFLADGTTNTLELWRGTLGDFWRVVWVTPLNALSDLPLFPALPLLAEPPAMTPTTTAAAPLPLSIGGSALITTTEGDPLRVRTGPGLSYAVLFHLPSDTRVSVREGPVIGDGYSWWRIETEDGRSGWAVEGVPEGDGWLQTLVPVGG